MDIEKLTQLLLEDRAKAAERPATPKATRPTGSDFDPFAITRWNVIAGGYPGYLVSTPVTKGQVGWFVFCRACGSRFESKGLAYCEACMDLAADERRAMAPAATGRLCEAPGCEQFIPRQARADARYCSQACQQRAKRARRDRDNPGKPPDMGSPENDRDKA